MKSTSIQPGVKATTKLNGRDQIVTVISKSLGTAGPTQWIVRTPAGNNVYRSARQLRQLPATPRETLNSPVDVGASHVSEYNIRQARAKIVDGIDAVEDRAHARAMRVGSCSGCGHPHGGPDCAVF